MVEFCVSRRADMPAFTGFIIALARGGRCGHVCLALAGADFQILLFGLESCAQQG